MKTRKHLLAALGTVAFGVLLVMPTLALAAAPAIAPAKPIDLYISIGGKKSVADLAEYIGVLYKWFIGAAMIVAAFMISVGGFQYITAGAVPKNLSAAKERIKNALIGLLLAISSYVILYTINPAMTNLKLPEIKRIENIPMPSKLCPKEGTKSICKCGTTCEGLDYGVPAGSKCMGQGGCDSGDCLNTAASNQEVSFGATTAAPIPSFACVSALKCALAQSNPSCAAITFEAFGPDWAAYCNSGICNAALNEKNGCIAREATIDGKQVRVCKSLGGAGDYCTLTPCAQGLLCNTSVTPSVCVAPKEVLAGEACKRNMECKSGMCNKYVGLSPGGGLCAPSSGYKTLAGNSRFEECDNATPLLWGEAQPQVCGEGWQCIDDAPMSLVDYHCSDLDTGSPCKDICKNATDECTATKESVMAGAVRTTCQPKETPAGAPATP